MIKAVIFDMFETLITLFDSPLYQGKQIAQDINIPEPKFREIWDTTESDRTLGNITVEEVIEKILRTNNVYSDELYNEIIEKRLKVTDFAFEHLHPQIIPMLEKLKSSGVKIALISNCFFEERDSIKKSVLWNYFDLPCLSCELGLQKPDVKIFEYCMNKLGVSAEECLYVGDGGSQELETAESLGMKTVQACWYLKEGTNQPVGRKREFEQMETPLDVVRKL